MRQRRPSTLIALAIAQTFALASCDVSADESGQTAASVPPFAENQIATIAPEPSANTATSAVIAKPSPQEASRFLMSATFGPNADSIEQLVELGYSEWFVEQFNLPVRSVLEASLPSLSVDSDSAPEGRIVIGEFYENAILGSDQLRMRAAYSLSQLFVISTLSNRIHPDGEGFARYVDILQEGAFGNFRDLLEEITYNPVMAEYLTYLGNRKANPDTGAAPDENYAREIMQLFTIGLYELNMDGSLKLDSEGRPIETYTNDDIQELAKVFTGLWFEGLPFDSDRNQRTVKNKTSRLTMFEEEHSNAPKSFLDANLPSTLSGDEAISMALDVLFEHPNTAPFVSKQLIQRMTTSNPSPEYVGRVARSFAEGRFVLPNGVSVGEGRRGDLQAVWASILMDEEYHDPSALLDPTFGKVREPVLRFTHWARMSNAPSVNLMRGRTIVDDLVLNQQFTSRLGQRPFTSPSVFNFYRPGYTAGGSITAQEGLVAPELQIMSATTAISYANFMRYLVFRDAGDGGSNGDYGLIGDYSAEISVAHDTDALISRLDLLLLAGGMTNETKRRLTRTIESVSLEEAASEERLRNRVQLAIQLLMVSPEYIVQQ